MKRLILSVAVAAGVLCGLQRAQATSLAPGAAVSPIDTGTLTGGSLVVSDTQTVNGVTLNYGVYKPASGGLDFLYQVTNPATTGTTSVTTLNTVDFTGYNTSVFNVATSPGGTFTTPTSGVTATGASRDGGGGASVSFSFTAKNGQTTSIMEIATNATNYTTGGSFALTSKGGFASFSNTFAPSPEPTSLVLMGGCFMGLCGVGLMRIRRRKTAPAA